MKKTDVSFWDLIREFSIAIPSIQRDYIQGAGTKQVVAARTTLLDDLAGACRTLKPINLNFIYGEVQGRGPGAVFLPLDGQQRLTTLFLIHWYAAAWSSDTNRSASEALLDALAKFTYETRVTSEEFFSRITDLDLVRGLQRANAPSIEIRNKNWFRPQWEFDPTVKSALLMLDEINQRFADVDGLAAILMSPESPIRFEWLDIEDIGNASDLYIKMNSRGKVLSEFDNFKAELEAAFPEGGDDALRQRFFAKMDQEWTDYFWNMGEAQDRELYGARFMNVLHTLLFNHWCTLETQFEDTDRWPGPVRDLSERSADRTLSDYALGLDEFDQSYPVGEEWFRHVENTLDHVVSEECAPEARAAVKEVAVTSPERLRQRDRFMMQVVSSYFGARGEEWDAGEWDNWHRTFRHVANHANTYQGYNAFTQYRDQVRQVVKLEDHADAILSYLASAPIPVKGFATEQITEEQLKAKLRVDDDWSDLIRKAESLDYFQGKVSFLLEFSGAIDGNSLSDHAFDVETKQAFAEYLPVVEGLFGAGGVVGDDDEADWLRSALLTKGDYPLPVGTLRTYIVQDSRDRDWRMLLRPRAGDFRTSRYFFKDLLDDLVLRSGPIEDRLDAIVDEYEWDPARKDTWNEPLTGLPFLFGVLRDHTKFLHIGERRVAGTTIVAVPARSNTTLHGYNSELHLQILSGLLSLADLNHVCYHQRGVDVENPPHIVVPIAGRDLRVDLDLRAPADKSVPSPRGFVVTEAAPQTHGKSGHGGVLLEGDIRDVVDYFAPDYFLSLLEEDEASV